MDTPLERAYAALSNIQRLDREMTALHYEYTRLSQLKDFILNPEKYGNAERSTT